MPWAQRPRSPRNWPAGRTAPHRPAERAAPRQCVPASKAKLAPTAVHAMRRGNKPWAYMWDCKERGRAARRTRRGVTRTLRPAVLPPHPPPPPRRARVGEEKILAAIAAAAIAARNVRPRWARAGRSRRRPAALRPPQWAIRSKRVASQPARVHVAAAEVGGRHRHRPPSEAEGERRTCIARARTPRVITAAWCRHQRRIAPIDAGPAQRRANDARICPSRPCDETSIQRSAARAHRLRVCGVRHKDGAVAIAAAGWRSCKRPAGAGSAAAAAARHRGEQRVRCHRD